MEDKDRKGALGREGCEAKAGRWVEGNTEKVGVSGYEDAGAQGCSGLLSSLNVGVFPKGESTALIGLQQPGW